MQELTTLSLTTLAENITAELQTMKYHAGEFAKSAINVGGWLIAAKEQQQHGQFTTWLGNNFKLSIRTARNWMALASRYSKGQPADVFNLTQLTEMLALNPSDEESFITSMKESGREVSEMSKRELRQAIKAFNKSQSADAENANIACNTPSEDTSISLPANDAQSPITLATGTDAGMLEENNALKFEEVNGTKIGPVNGRNFEPVDSCATVLELQRELSETQKALAEEKRRSEELTLQLANEKSRADSLQLQLDAANDTIETLRKELSLKNDSSVVFEQTVAQDGLYSPPAEVISACREMLGKDATVEMATLDSLNQVWHGNVIISPQYRRGVIDKLVSKLLEELKVGNVKNAIFYTFKSENVGWFKALKSAASAIVITKNLKIYDGEGKELAKNPQKKPPVIFYFGDVTAKFIEMFSKFGQVILNERTD